MKKSMLVAAMSVAMLAASATGAAASHTGYLTVTPFEAGCEVKGLFLQPAPGSGGLPAATYTYAVTAVNDQETKACPPVSTVTTSTGGIILSWLIPPGGAPNQYKIYRSVNGGAFVNVATLAGSPATTQLQDCGAQNAKRCRFVDTGQNTTGTTQANPNVVPTITDANTPADLRLVQRIDYGGSDNNTPAASTADDPFPAALKTDKLKFPPGLVPFPGAAPKCALTGANSFLGDPDVAGDANEDTCPRNTLLGTVTTISRIPEGNQGATRIVVTPGEIYNGATKGTEPGRLFIVLRPACSKGSVIPPGNAACPPTGAGSFVNKEFLTAIANIVDRGNQVYAVDTDIRNAKDDGDLPSALDIYAANGTTKITSVPVQVRQLTQDLLGRADQDTRTSADDIPFVTLPTSCGDKTFQAEKTTTNDATVHTSSAGFPINDCATVPFHPEMESQAGGPGQNAAGAKPGLIVTVRQNVGEATMKKAVVRLPQTLAPNVPALQTQCTETQLQQQACPAASRKGTAQANSPLLPFQLEGPVYLMENPTGLPSLAVFLQGPGVTVRLRGDLELGANGLINTFDNLPEVPLSKFTLQFGGGENGTLFNATDLCKGGGTISATFTGWNGVVVERSQPMAVDQSGCPSSYPLPTVGKPSLAASISRVRTGRPTLKETVRSGAGRKLKSVRFTLPRGVKFNVRSAKRYCRFYAGGKRFKKGISYRSTRITVTKRTTKLQMTCSRGAVRVSSTIRRRGRNQRLTFKARTVLSDNKVFNLSKRVKPSS